MIHGTESFYRSFSIPKRSGGRRDIVAPYPSLLSAQRWIYENILTSVKISRYAFGFRADKSILDNALVHCGRQELLKVDIKDFFPSISFSQIISIFQELGYPRDVAFYLARLCTLDGSLPQGAASSPALSNIVCRRMDDRFYKLAKSCDLRYTRYADDIVFSGDDIPDGIARLVFEILSSEGYAVNESKVRFLKAGDKKLVTGLDITSGSPRVPREFRRELMKDLYHVWSSGLALHVSRRKIFNPNYLLQLEGRVSFWAQIEPESAQLKKAQVRMREIFSRDGRP